MMYPVAGGAATRELIKIRSVGIYDLGAAI